MKVLLDNCTPRPLKAFLTGHEVKTAHEMGWAALMNGELLAAAENEFDLLITCDRNLRYQQNLTQRTIRLLDRTNRCGTVNCLRLSGAGLHSNLSAFRLP